MSQGLMKRATAFGVVVAMMLPSLPSAVAATRATALPSRVASLPVLTLGDTQAHGAHYAQRWETLSDLARQAQGQGSLTKSGPRAFLAEPFDVVRLTTDVLRAGEDLTSLAADLDAQFARDAQYLREKGLPEVFRERLARAYEGFRERHARVDEALAQLARAQKLANYDAQKIALAEMAKLVAAMPSAKSFVPASKEALARVGAAPGKPVFELAAAKSLAKAAPASPAPEDLLATDDVQLTTKIREQAAALGNNPVAIFNWVRNTIDYLPTHGSIQGSEMTRINKRGNAIDTASLLLALLRSAGIASRYAEGFVEMPIARAQNWLGGNIAPNQVVELMTKGGIPAQAVVSGGQVATVRFKHTWVEAYVDFTPSRGAVNRAPQTWVPMDASFKTHDVHAPINLTQGTAFDSQGLLNQAHANAVKGPNFVTGFDLTAIDAAYAAYRPAAIDYANQVRPGARLVDVRGFAAIVPENPPILAGTLPYVVATQGNRYAVLPATHQHHLEITYYASEADYAADSGVVAYSTPLAKVGLATIGVDYVPATQADRDLYATLRRDNAASLSPYLLNVVPQVQIEGVAVNATPIPAVQMGTVQYWKADITDPQGIYPATIAGNRVTAGSHVAYVVNAAGVTADMVQKRLDLIPDGVSYPLREGLQQAGMHFWMLRDSMDQNWASQFGGKVVRLPSVGAFSAPLQATYAFGVARTGFFNGYQTDIKRNIYAAVNDTPARQLQMFTLIGNTGSLLEAGVWEAMFGEALGSGASTARILAVANEQKIPVYLVDASNIATVNPLLQISADAKQEIANAVAAGKRVVVPEREVTIGKWKGTGYVIQDPATGEGVYQIDGGLSGGVVAGCLIKALLESCFFQKLLAKHLQRFLNSLMDKALTSAALLAPAGAQFGVAIALSAQYMWFIAFHLAVIDLAEMIATGQAEELALSLLACTRKSNCGFGGFSANPVFMGTGEKLQLDADYIGGGDNPLVLTRTYLSFARDTGGRMGRKWRHSYERSIFIPPPTTGVDQSGAPIGGGYSIVVDNGERAAPQITAISPVPDAALVLRGDGGYIQFDYRGTSYVANSDVGEFLTRQADGSGRTTGWTYFNEQDETEVYDAAGRLTSITSQQGMTQTLSYDLAGRLAQVRDHFGRTLSFAYNAAGDVETVTDPAAGLIRYGYNTEANLTSVQTPDLMTRRYHYEQGLRQAWLTGITDENGNRFATYRYDFQGRVVNEFHAGGVQNTSFVYEGELRTRMTDALGTVRTYDFRKIFENKRLTKVTEPCTSGCANGGVAELDYDANGFISSQTDFNGNRTFFSRDLRGLERSRTEASGTPVARTITTDYDPQWRVPKTLTEPTSAGPRVTTFTLDPRGNIKTKSVTVAGETRSWTYDHNGVGQVTLVDGPRTDVADVTTRTYVNGNLDTVTDAAGNVTRYGNYDPHGRAQSMTDANGLVTAMTYDARGRLKTSSAGGETTAYDYDGAGNLEKLTLPDGTFLRYGYDAAQRLTSITDSLGNSVAYTLDELGNRKKEDTKDPAGALAQTMSRVFDGLSRVKEMLGAQSQRTVYGYDAQGNLKSATDPLTHTTTNDYDPLNRLKKVIEPQLAGAPAAGEIAYGYDARDNLTSVTDQRSLVTTYGYSGFDELKTLTSPDTGVTQYTYDAAGNVKTMQDSRGQAATYSYDPLDRLKTLLYSDESLGFTYDDVTASPNSKGRLSKVTDGSGSTTYGYDLQGRVTSKLQVAGSVTSQVRYTYNTVGQLATITTPSNQAIAYGYTNNQITSISVNGVSVVANARYFPFGEVQKWTWGNGQGYERVYDLDGRIKSVTLGANTRTYGFDDASRITALEDKQVATSLSAATVGYDNLDRLTAANQTGANAFAELFVYDLIGNRTSQTVGGASTTLTYGTTSNRVTQIGPQAIGYDNAGNTINDGTLTYTYSGRNRLIEVKQGASTLAAYKHNAFGERIAKTLGGTTTTFVYDEDGHLLGEYGVAGALIQETVWLEDTPVATLRPKAGGGIDIRYVWADHLDTPRAITSSDAASTVLWTWNSDPFGTTAAGGTLEYNQRFPGQYFDAETATHYNYFRDYNPNTGRYQQSDPIGAVFYKKLALQMLAAKGRTKLNLEPLLTPEIPVFNQPYLYVFGNPASAFDDTGLAGKRFTPDQSALIGLAKDCKRRGGVSCGNADTLLGWGKEYNLPCRDDRNTSHWKGGPHIHIGPVSHIPIKKR